MVDFHGWTLPVQYEGILAEHRHCRQAACVFDTSHMGQLLIRPAAAEALARVTTQDAAALEVGRARYGFLLNDGGGILDDTILMRLDEREFLLVVNAGRTGDDLAWVRSHLEGGAEIENLSATGWAKLDLQGPLAAEVLAPLTDADLRTLGYFRATRAGVCGCECILSRTGYTGELGYELFAPAEAIVQVFDALRADARVRPAGLGARDSLRLEMGYPLYGQDITAETNPVQAELGAFAGEHEHIGAAAVRAAAAQGPVMKLVALAAGSRRRGEHGDGIFRGDEPVGHVTSAAFSPSLETSIGLGYVRSDLAEPNTELTVRTARAELPVTVRPKPLYAKGTCRIKL